MLGLKAAKKGNKVHSKLYHISRTILQSCREGPIVDHARLPSSILARQELPILLTQLETNMLVQTPTELRLCRAEQHGIRVIHCSCLLVKGSSDLGLLKNTITN